MSWTCADCRITLLRLGKFRGSANEHSGAVGKVKSQNYGYDHSTIRCVEVFCCAVRDNPTIFCASATHTQKKTQFQRKVHSSYTSEGVTSVTVASNNIIIDFLCSGRPIWITFHYNITSSVCKNCPQSATMLVKHAVSLFYNYSIKISFCRNCSCAVPFNYTHKHKPPNQNNSAHSQIITCSICLFFLAVDAPFFAATPAALRIILA